MASRVHKFVHVGSHTVRLKYVVAGAVAAALLIVTVGLLAGLLNRPPCPDAGARTQPTSAPNGTQPPSSSPAPTTPDPNRPWLTMRLPDYLVPLHYRVRLHPRLGVEAAQGFTGEVDIRLKLRRPAKYILVHVKYLNVTSTQVIAEDSTQLPLARTFNYTENQFWVIEMANELRANAEPVVKLTFKGFYFGIVGLYQSTYTENNVTKYLATTKFEPTDARKAFPCLDEPQLKATFTVELEHQGIYHALSNMPVDTRQNTSTGLVLTTFKETPRMSTYLFCILISQFSSQNATSSGGNPFRAWAPTSLINQTSYALTSGVTTQDFLGRWLNYSYDRQFPKQDMAAIPDFPSGAMEHWGLITYRDTAMLFDSTDGSAVNKQRVVTIVAHELAHMWFGNLVTMLWWNDLWLNEGFASYFADIGAANVERNWELREQGIVTTYNSAFGADDAITSHPVIVDTVATPQEITQIFDTITYSKGQAVLTQLEDFMGMADFQLGLRDYLKVNEYGVATTVQLYQSLQKYTSRNVTEFMDRWTRQMGFPLVTVSAGSNPSEVVLTQSWFLRQPDTRPQAPVSPYGYQWIIKLNYRNVSLTDSYLMRDTQAKLLVSNYDSMTPPLKFNLGQMGFYRVNYPTRWWDKFASALRANVASYNPVDRAGLIGDAFAVALGNQLGYDSVVKLLSYLSSERHYLPWYTATSGLNSITRQLERRATYGQWSGFGRSITAGVYNAIGWGTKSAHLDKLLQPIVLNLACRFGNANCLAQAKSQFTSWRNGASINAELRQIVYTYGLMESDTQEVWDFVWQKYLASNIATERERLLRALAMTKNSWLVNRLLQFSRDRSKVRGQDFVTLIGYIGANPNALEILWNWCRTNWQSLLVEFGHEDRRLGAMIPGFAQQFNDQFHLDEYENFTRNSDPGAGQNARLSTLSIIKSNILWIEANEQELIDALGQLP